VRATVEAVGLVGHRVHVCRAREVGTLLRWLGDVRGRRVLDVAGGDGWWAGRLTRAGALAVSLDLDRPKMLRGRTYADHPGLVEGDALALPFADGAFDAVMSVCAIEHFPDGPRALDEMARVLRPGGTLVMSADALTRADRYPSDDAEHRRRYAVLDTYDHERLRVLLAERGLEVLEHSYLFRSAASERFYLGMSAHGGRYGWNAAAPLLPWFAWSDRRSPNEAGSVVLVRARKAEVPG
jgi:SAM-dependent methyltransferase